MKNTDAFGRVLKVGDVCGYASRRASTLLLEPVIVRQVTSRGVKGDKIVTERVAGEVVVYQVETHPIVRTDHLVITGLTEDEVLKLMSIP